jgi:hypothetical protein
LSLVVDFLEVLGRWSAAGLRLSVGWFCRFLVATALFADNFICFWLRLVFLLLSRRRPLSFDCLLHRRPQLSRVLRLLLLLDRPRTPRNLLLLGHFVDAVPRSPEFDA